MKEVRVLIDNFHDKENFNKEITIKRKGKEVKVKCELLHNDDIYYVTKERFKYLAEKKIVEEVKKPKEETTNDTNEGE